MNDHLIKMLCLIDCLATHHDFVDRSISNIIWIIFIVHDPWLFSNLHSFIDSSILSTADLNSIISFHQSVATDFELFLLIFHSWLRVVPAMHCSHSIFFSNSLLYFTSYLWFVTSDYHAIVDIGLMPTILVSTLTFS